MFVNVPLRMGGVRSELDVCVFFWFIQKKSPAGVANFAKNQKNNFYNMKKAAWGRHENYFASMG